MLRRARPLCLAGLLLCCGAAASPEAAAEAAEEAAEEGARRLAEAIEAHDIPVEARPVLQQAAARWLQSVKFGGPKMNANLAFDDANLDFTCTLGLNCTGGGMPAERGICVRAGFTNACWDVCNPKHSPQDYRMGDNPAVNSAFAGLVAQVRAGLNSYVQCPGALKQGDTCPPGSPCTYSMRRFFKIQEGRGMCVVDASQLNSRACWDMCDLRKDPSSYAEGSTEDVPSKVRQVRSSGICPGTPWWRWLIVALVTLLILTCCVGAFIAQRMSRKRISRGSTQVGSRLEQGEMPQDYLDPLDPRDEKGYQEEMRMPEDYVSAHGPGVLEVDQVLPPEPPPLRQAAYDSRAPLTYSHDDYGSYSREMPRVPGMDEPRLPQPQLQFPGIQPPVAPATVAQAATPELLRQAAPIQVSAPTVTAPYRLPSVASSSPGAFQTFPPVQYTVAAPTYTTQIVSPPVLVSTSSVQVRTPVTAPASTFFSQIQRR